jgi:long-subunit acyl-CoA synthetase (AMP-forming)
VEKQVYAQAAKQGPKKEAQLRRALSFATKLQDLFPDLGAALAKFFLRQVTDKLFGRSVMFCISGGSYLRNSAMELLNGIGYCLHNGFGMSEIGITSVELRRRPKDRNLNSVGHPFSSVEYRLDKDGCLQVRGTSLCVRKLINGEPAQLDGWFDTNDRMECRDGHYYILGRKSDTVIGENGENINPDMVEKAFNIDSAKQLCVLGLPGENGQELSMVVQISPYITQERIDQIKKQIYQVNETFPIAVAVKRFYFTYDELAPATAIKISRAQLSKRIENDQVKLTAFQQFAVEVNADGRQSVLFQRVREIIARVLDTDETAICAQTHIFYDLGATSIQYFSILAALAEHFSIADYEDSGTFCYTPKEICEYLERKL